jgi:hypothetical protein
MTMTLTPAPYAVVGDLIQASSGQLFRVTKVKQVNYGVVDEDGKNWNLRKTGAYLAPAGAVFSGPGEAPASRPLATEVPLPRMDLTLGVVVEFKPGSKFHGKGKFVIVRVNGATYSLAKLNGDGGRYVRGASGSYLEVVHAE